MIFLNPAVCLDIYIYQDMSKSSEQLPQHSIWIYHTTLTTPCSGVLCLLQDIEHVHVLSQIQNTMNEEYKRHIDISDISTISGSLTSRCGKMHSCVQPSYDEHVSRLGSHGAHWTSPRDKSQNGHKGPAALPAQEIWEQGVWLRHYIMFWHFIVLARTKLCDAS